MTFSAIDGGYEEVGSRFRITSLYLPATSYRPSNISCSTRHGPTKYKTMEISIAALLVTLFLFDSTLATETQSTSTTKAPATTKKPVKSTPAAAEGRKMEISDAQLEMALKDKRYLQRQLKCTLGEATCDPVGRRLKTLAPLVIRGSCPQCTPTEMRQIQKVLLHMQRNFPKEWAKVVRNYQ